MRAVCREHAILPAMTLFRLTREESCDSFELPRCRYAPWHAGMPVTDVEINAKNRYHDGMWQ